MFYAIKCSGLPIIQILITCSKQNGGGRPGNIYHVNDVNCIDWASVPPSDDVSNDTTAPVVELKLSKPPSHVLHLSPEVKEEKDESLEAKGNCSTEIGMCPMCACM